MLVSELYKDSPNGFFMDKVIDPKGRVTWSSDWKANTIVDDCRRLLAAFAHGSPTASMGIQGLLVGAGSADWDTIGSPSPVGNETQLMDPNPFLVSGGNLKIDYLAGDSISSSPTNRLQILASLGPGVPAWPDSHHPTGNLREFGLAADLDGTRVLMNYVIHPLIAKDPTSTLERTIWLVF